MNLEELLLDALEKVKAYDVIVYDMEEKTPFYDKMIISTVDSVRQSDSVVSYIEDNLENSDYTIRSIEGKGSGWVLVDCNSIIVSIFSKEMREHYSLEKLYMDIKQRRIDN